MSQTLTDKVNYLAETKNQIKIALQTNGATITDNTPFRQYASAINTMIANMAQQEDLYILMGADMINQSLYTDRGENYLNMNTQAYLNALSRVQPLMQLHINGGVTSE